MFPPVLPLQSTGYAGYGHKGTHRHLQAPVPTVPATNSTVPASVPPSESSWLAKASPSTHPYAGRYSAAQQEHWLQNHYNVPRPAHQTYGDVYNLSMPYILPPYSLPSETGSGPRHVSSPYSNSIPPNQAALLSRTLPLSPDLPYATAPGR